MPLYEYDCVDCHGQFEVLVRTPSSDSRPACPDCGSTKVRRVLSLVAQRSRSTGEMAMMTAPAAPRGGGCCGGGCGCGH
jgi:putative FmdB family regulatory protein